MHCSLRMRWNSRVTDESERPLDVSQQVLSVPRPHLLRFDFHLPSEGFLLQITGDSLRGLSC